MRKYALFLFLLIPITLNACSTIPGGAPVDSRALIISPGTLVARHDMTHIVAPGETLWRIGKMYDVPVTDIMNANELKKSSGLSMGQSLLIPNAAALRSVIPLYPNSKWKYIIVHHSATDRGDSLSFNRHHIERGFEGVGYHFVIDNGTQSKVDGQIEVSPRWLKQRDGAHCKASEMNCKAIGICLVGNFNEESVSDDQMNSLVFLVNTLRNQYQIPLKNIMGHGQVPSAKTDCPGKKFPWREFRSALGKA